MNSRVLERKFLYVCQTGDLSCVRDILGELDVPSNPESNTFDITQECDMPHRTSLSNRANKI